jgi:hypothetical protein
MFFALNMELQIIRTVLKNDVNEIYVCTDVSKGRGNFYTLVSIQEVKYRKKLAEQMNMQGLFFGNKDFVGSFHFSNKLNLVFRYHTENLLSALGSVYLSTFAECKQAAANLVAAFAEAGMDSGVGTLLLKEPNINITSEGNIYFNYFLDFASYEENQTPEEYVNCVSEKAFEILEIKYKEKYRTRDMYPNDLLLYDMKMQHRGFSTFGQIIITIRTMADVPVEMRGLIWWVKNRIKGTRSFLFKNASTAFLTILIVITVVFTVSEINKRLSAERAFKNNVSYSGIEYIGSVYLGNEE